MLKNGYTLFVINHRSSPVFRYPAAVEDAQRAVQFIRHHAAEYNINKDRLGAIGHSSGAHLVSMLGTLDDNQTPDAKNPIDRESSKVQAVVGLAGVFDLTSFAIGAFGDIGAITSFVGTHLPAWRGADAPNHFEYARYRAASPVSYVTDDDASFLLVHGTNENVIHPDQSRDFHALLLENEIHSNLVIIENGGHGLRVEGEVAQNQYFDEVVKLFDSEILGK